ncbi:hypothetical protein U91I_02016 [alpha proteobacterium U9-1i]|nr:hypothetical protein U91I_02016 [alpha proteobacterium U9-1i]
MITWKYKLWQTAGAAAALSLAACGGEGGAGGEAGSGGEGGEAAQHGEAGEAAPTAGGEAGEAAIGESGGEQGEAGVATAYAGVSGDQLTALRLQHLKGFLLVAGRVAEGDTTEEAGVLVSQGLLEVYDPSADQFGALDIAPVRAATEAASSRQQMAQRIQAGEAAINAARTGLEIDHAALTARMLDLSAGLYQHVIQADFIDPIEYQHSLGAALSARDALVAGETALKARNARAYDTALADLNRFIDLWPAATAPERPATYAQVLAASSRVRLALSPFL